MNIEESIKCVIANILNIEKKELSLDTDLIKLGLDSLNLIQLVVQLENFFYISISYEMLLKENFCTVKKIKQVIIKYL